MQPEVAHFLRIRMAEEEEAQKQRNMAQAQELGIPYEEFMQQQIQKEQNQVAAGGYGSKNGRMTIMNSL